MAPLNKKMTEQITRSTARLYILLYVHMYGNVYATRRNHTVVVVVVSVLITIGIVDYVSVLTTIFSSSIGT